MAAKLKIGDRVRHSRDFLAVVGLGHAYPQIHRAKGRVTGLRLISDRTMIATVAWEGQTGPVEGRLPELIHVGNLERRR